MEAKIAKQEKNDLNFKEMLWKINIFFYYLTVEHPFVLELN